MLSEKSNYIYRLHFGTISINIEIIGIHCGECFLYKATYLNHFFRKEGCKKSDG